MSYLRPVKLEELKTWLLEKGFAEEESGFGHVDAETLAEALMDRFEIITKSSTL